MLRALNNAHFQEKAINTPQGHQYHGLTAKGEVSAVIVLRGGATFEASLRRVIPDCRTGRILIQSDLRTGEPELHYLKLPNDIHNHDTVLLLDSQMSSGGSALMAVQVLVDHGVPQRNTVLQIQNLTKVFPDVTVVVGNMVSDFEQRWVEQRYFRC